MFDLVTAETDVWWEDAYQRAEDLLAWELTDNPPDLPADTDGVAGLTALKPGVVLAAALSVIDVSLLSGGDRVHVLAACQRMASHFQARVYAAMTAVAQAVEDTLTADGETDVGLIEGASSAEIAAALRLTRRAADAELDMARRYQTRLPAVWEALASGVIDRRRANLIVHRTDHLPNAQAREVARQVLEQASGMTTGQLSARLRRLSMEADPEDAKHRYQTALSERRVELEPGVDGTAHLHLRDVPPDRAARIRSHIETLAHTLRTGGETRTLDQLRADVTLDLLDPQPSTHRKRSTGRGAITLTVDLATLTGLTETAGDLGGYGPVISDIARHIATESPDSEWRYCVTDHHGQPVCTGITRRRPTNAQRRIVETTHPRCVFPGCRAPAVQCDLDHTAPWAYSHHTCAHCLAPLCRHQHTLRHQGGWTYHHTPNGHTHWTSPLGHHYTTRPRGP
jgi:hypothetical protein